MRILGRLAIVAALVVSAGAAAPLSAGATATPSASCTGSAGDVGISPGLVLVANPVQALSFTGATVACTGGWVSDGTVRTGALNPLTQQGGRNCQELIAGIPTKTPKWNGMIKMTWNAGMDTSKANVQAFVKATSGNSTTFHYYGRVKLNSGANLFGGLRVTGNFTIDKGLNSLLNGGDCTVTIPITSASITASTLKILAA